MNLPVFPNWYPYNDMLLDGHLQVGAHGVKTRSYDWKYRGPVLLYNSGRTAHYCVHAYGYPKKAEHRGCVIGVANLEDVRLLTDREWRKMERNFKNLTARQWRDQPEKVEVYPYSFGYFFSDIRRFENPVSFKWPAGPVRPIFTRVAPGSPLGRELIRAGVLRLAER